jgi:hypothetical protein
MKKIYFILIGSILFFLASYSSVLAAVEDTPWPTVKVDVIPPGLVQPGQEIMFRASHSNFSLKDEDKNRLFFNWCIEDVPLNGLVAGSLDDQIKGTEGAYYLENRYGRIDGGSGACQVQVFKNPVEGPINFNEFMFRTIWNPPEKIFMTRTPNIDEDRDGLDDDWEVRYFAGRRIPGTEDFYPSGEDRAALLAAVKPQDDPDKDGFDFETAVPSVFARHEFKHSPYQEAWTMGVPYAKRNRIGDGKFTNLEEFTFGTDPLNSDTDQDGIWDEADVAGREQDRINVRINKDWGGKYKINLHAFGVTQRWRQDWRNPKRGWEQFERADFPNTNEADGRTISEEGVNIISVGAGLPLNMATASQPSPVYPGEVAEVTAEAVQLAQLKGLNLFYRWFLDGILQKSDEETKEVRAGEGAGEPQSGYGKKTFRFPVTKQACDQHIVTAEVTEKNTGKMNTNNIPITVGFPTVFKIEVLGNIDLKSEAAQEINQRTGSRTKVSDILLPGDRMRGEISPEVGFRQGDAFRVTVNNLEQGWTSLCGGANFQEFLDDLTFRWNYAGVEQESKSGKGENFSQAEFIIKRASRNPRQGSGSPVGSQADTSGDYVNLEITNNVGEVISRTREDIRVIPPYIDLQVEGADLATSDVSTSQPQYMAAPGANVKVTATLHYLRPSAGINYTWERNGQTANELKNTDVIVGTYSFRAGFDAEGKPTNAAEERISLEVENKVNSSNVNEKEYTDNNVVIKIATPTGTTGAAIGAALQKFVPEYFKNVFNLALGAGLMSMVLLLGLGFMKGSAKK